MKQFCLICNLGLYNAIRRIREKSQIFFLRRIKIVVNKIKKYIRKVSVGFVKCHEWRVASLACNRPILDRHVRAVGGLCRSHCLYDVTTISASVCVVSLISCSRVSTAFCDTISLNTDAISIDVIIRRRETALPPPVGLSVSNLPPPCTPSFMAELNGSSWRQDNR